MTHVSGVTRWLRWRERPGALGAGLLIATFVLAGALALEAARASRAQRAAAERMLDDYAHIAAWQFARNGRTWLGFALGQGLTLLTREAGQFVVGPLGGFTLRLRAGPLPEPDRMARVFAAEDCECFSAVHARTFFRVHPDSSVAVAGAPLPDSVLRALAAQALAEPGRGRPRRWRILPAGTPGLPDTMATVVYWRILAPILTTPAAEADSFVAAYGMVLGPEQFTRAMQRGSREAAFLPPPLNARLTGDSLVHIAVTTPAGGLVYASGAAPDGGHTATDTLGATYGDLRVTATIRPDAAPRVAFAPAPGAGRRTLVLLALTLAVGMAALLLLRRERQLARLRDDFVSGVSHELRTPLTQIRMLSELLLQDGFRQDEERARATAVIHRESLRLTNLVENVLQFTRRPRPAPPREDVAVPVPVGEVIAEVAEAFAPIVREREARLVVAAPPGLAVAADRDAVARILRNLVENALKYGPPGQTVRLSVRRAADGVQLIVEDEGPGVPPAQRERIWEPYQRLARDRNAAGGGSGLGLAVVSGLARQFGGHCAVDGAEGQGARFVVTLPAAAGV